MPSPRKLAPLVCAAALLTAAYPACANIADHREFEASLYAPYRGEPGRGEARAFRLRFDYPGNAAARRVTWTLELAARGTTLRRWEGSVPLAASTAEAKVDWDGKLPPGAGPALGTFTVRLHATLDDGSTDEQTWDITTGTPHADLAPLRAARRVAALPYTVYYGNLHSQTNHSDGGGDVRTCTGAQDPQSALYGPGDAYTFARTYGLDFLMASEHNHMFDGSDGTNANADAEWARMLYRSGLTAANDFNTAWPGFLALYGMEWGVIGNGGHLNILNAPELLGWERNASGDLLADLYTARSDYATLYALMQRRGWIGQFNHPALTGQFMLGDVPLAYSPDGDQAMALCEVLNTSAFSSRTNESETSRRTFEEACNRLLEAGYHVAFSSDQDNHCANWGASYTNRTGVLVPGRQPLNSETFMEAIKARRVFATMDKTARVVLTANGHVMGERFINSGPLQLSVDYASSSGKSAAAVVIMEGVPGRNGQVAPLPGDLALPFLPTPGEHFYYAKVTQDDGNLLWSAPVWVTQRP